METPSVLEKKEGQKGADHAPPCHYSQRESYTVVAMRKERIYQRMMSSFPLFYMYLDADFPAKEWEIKTRWQD